MTKPINMTTLTEMDLSPEPWSAINDVVMGGLSSGGMERFGRGLRFRGEISLQNNGGFASVRRMLGEDLADSCGIRLTLKGDGRKYQLRLRHGQNLDGIAWRCEFRSEQTMQVIDMYYTEFEPVFRGRIVTGAGIIQPALLRQIGFMLADRTDGAFMLDILKIEVLRGNRTVDGHGDSR